MKGYLDRLEAIASLSLDFECHIHVDIHCSRDKFNSLKAEIEDEYDLSTVDDVKLTQEKIPNQLSNIHILLLHGQLLLFHIKD